MKYPKTGTLLQPRINSTLSSQIIIKVDNVTTVGAIQQLQINQKRGMKVWEEIGTDGIIEIHPQGAAKIDLTVNRIIFDQLSLVEALGRGFVNIHAQRIPFDIQVMNTSDGSNNTHLVVHNYNNCWFNSLNTTYVSNNYLITEIAGVVCEYVTTTVNGLSSVYGGLRGITFINDSMERSTDVTGRRGSFNSSGFSS